MPATNNDRRMNSHDTPASEAGVPRISTPPPVAPSYSDFDAHHYNNRYARSQVASRGSNHNNNDDDGREAVELDELPSPRPSSISTASISSGECRAPRSFRVITQASTIRPDDGPFRKLRKFWLRNVVLTVPHHKNRDHFALERTYLAYIRTSLTFSFLGVLIAQLFRLQMNVSGPVLGFDDLGIPLACGCYGASIMIAIIGAHRFWRQQSAMAKGQVYAGGWELNSIGIIGVIIPIAILSLAIIVKT